MGIIPCKDYFGLIESKKSVSFFLRSNVSFLVKGRVSFFLSLTMVFFVAGITVLFLGFISWEKPNSIKKKQQKKSMYDRFVCNAINTIFV